MMHQQQHHQKYYRQKDTSFSIIHQQQRRLIGDHSWAKEGLLNTGDKQKIINTYLPNVKNLDMQEFNPPSIS